LLGSVSSPKRVGGWVSKRRGGKVKLNRGEPRDCRKILGCMYGKRKRKKVDLNWGRLRGGKRQR